MIEWGILALWVLSMSNLIAMERLKGKIMNTHMLSIDTQISIEGLKQRIIMMEKNITSEMIDRLNNDLVLIEKYYQLNQ